MVSLLKYKSKIITTRRSRKTYEVKKLFKRPKLSDKKTTVPPASQNIPKSEDNKAKETKKVQPTMIEKYDH